MWVYFLGIVSTEFYLMLNKCNFVCLSKKDQVLKGTHTHTLFTTCSVAFLLTEYVKKKTICFTWWSKMTFVHQNINVTSTVKDT